MDCSRVRAEGIAESYLLGRLDEPDREAFEDHLVTCADCAEELAGLCALQSELERSRERIVAEAAAPSGPSRRNWLLAAAAAALIVVTGLGLWTRLQPTEPRGPVLAELVPVTALEPTPGAGIDLVGLAAFEPPRYAPVRLRGREDEAERRFAEAMELYSRGDWTGALPGLRAAAALDPDASHTAFYHGACALLAGETDEAVLELERCGTLGDTPVLEEARFLLAKAHLREGDVPAAREQLVQVVALDGDRLEEAKGLLDRLDGLGVASR